MKVVIIGNGGHSKVISDVIRSSENINLIGYLDDKYRKLEKKSSYLFGPISEAVNILEMDKECKFIIGIGENKTRQLIFEKLKLELNFYATLIHPSAIISTSATIGSGTVILPGAIVNAEAIVGNHSIINTGSIIEHDCIIKDYVHVSPNATLTGGVCLREGVLIGASATILPELEIGKWTKIGAGAAVIKSLPANCTAVGVPARII
ncbi:acetyltransferase [Peribacillus kribbensis]|uniref:acetyltransferase n=1 Tax=Peribacillus kribbensis TaxID=356658 RepID=UPI0004011A8E|nr:acetyltransferase [Peribacillus kribbensis]